MFGEDEVCVHHVYIMCVVITVVVLCVCVCEIGAAGGDEGGFGQH